MDPGEAARTLKFQPTEIPLDAEGIYTVRSSEYHAWDFYPRSGFDPRFDPDPIQKSRYSEGPNPDPDRSKSGSGYPPDIIIFRRISDTRISENPGSG
ncbi:hypothetical protein YC2023_049993 [Brassica napus]